MQRTHKTRKAHDPTLTTRGVHVCCLLAVRPSALAKTAASARAKAQTRSNIKTITAQLHVTQEALKYFGRFPGHSYERCGMSCEIYSRKQTLSTILENKTLSTSILVVLLELF